MRITPWLILILFCSQLSAKIPIEAFAKADEYTDVKLSPSGKYMAVEMKNSNEIDSVVILRTSDMKSMSAINFGDKKLPVSPVWLTDERVLIKVGRKFGDAERAYLTGELFAMNADGSKKRMLIRRQFAVQDGNLPDAVGNDLYGATEIVSLLNDDKSHILISVRPFGVKDVLRFNDVYKINIFNGKVKHVIRSPIEDANYVVNRAGEIKYAWGIEQNNKNELKVYKNTKKGWQIFKNINSKAVNSIPISTVENTSTIILRQSYTDKTDALVSINLDRGQENTLFQHPEVDFNHVEVDTITGEPLVVHFEPDYNDIALLDEQHPVARWYPSLYKKFKNKRIKISSSDRDAKKFIFIVSSEKIAAKFYLFDTEKKKYQLLLNARDWLKEDTLAEMIPVSFTNREKEKIHGLLTLPNGKESQLATIIMPHGGPQSRDYWQYNSHVQFLASRGYAVLQINFRGSTGYGYKFEESGYQQWGHNIQHDIIDGTKWLIELGVAKRGNICIFGASFGGYSSLMAPVLEPELFRCAIGYAGVYDLNMMWREGDIQKSGYGSNALEMLIGKNEKQLAQFSPANHAEKIKIPVFLVHGEDDERAPVSHYLAMLNALNKTEHKNVQSLLIEDEGHGFIKQKNRQALYKRIEKFLSENIK